MEQHKAGSAFNPYKQFEGFNVIPDCISSLPTISPLAKLVYGHLVRRAGKNGMAFPSVESIGKHFAVSERQARRAVSELRNENLIRTVRRVNEHGQTTNLYQFVWHDWMKRRTDMSATERTDVSARRDNCEETRLPEEHDLEPLATNASHSQPAVSRDVLSTALFSVKSGGQLNTSPPTTGITQYARKACIAAAERHLSDAAIAATISTIPHVPGASYAYYITSAANAYADQRNGYYNWRPEHTTASPEFEHGTHMAEVLDDEPVGAVQ